MPEILSETSFGERYRSATTVAGARCASAQLVTAMVVGCGDWFGLFIGKKSHRRVSLLHQVRDTKDRNSSLQNDSVCDRHMAVTTDQAESQSRFSDMAHATRSLSQSAARPVPPSLLLASDSDQYLAGNLRARQDKAVEPQPRAPG